MKALLILLICGLALVQQSSADNFPRVKLLSENQSRITLLNTNRWTDFPELKLTFDLAKESLVNVGYVITIGSTGASHIVTRVLVDNREDQSFRAITGNTVYHTNAVNGFVSLDAGKHTIKVQYRTPGRFSMTNGEDWTVAQLEITY